MRNVVPRSPAVFVGRSEELARLIATADRLRLATVCGVGGIGKTSLLLHAAELLAAQQGGALAYHACRDGDSVASVLAAVKEQLGGDLITTTVPVVVVIDDLHRARDPMLVEALVRIALARLPIWIWLGSRELVAIDPVELDHVALRLEALSPGDAAQLWSELARMYGAPTAGFDGARRSPLQLKQAFGGLCGGDRLGLDELAPAACDLLRQLAAFRKPVAVDALAADRAALDELVRRLLVDVTAGMAVVHDLVREAIVPAPADHRRCLAYYLTAPAGELEVLHHAVACGADAQALDILAQYAVYARGIFPPDAWTEHELAVALEALAARAPLPRELALLLLRIRWRQGHFERAYRELGALAGDSGLADLDFGEAAFTVGRLDEAVPALERVLASDLPALARCWGAVVLAEALHQSGHIARARRVLSPEAACFRDAGVLGTIIVTWAGAVRLHDCEDSEGAGQELAKVLAWAGPSARAIPLAASMQRAIAVALGRPCPDDLAEDELYADTLYLRMAARLMRAVEHVYRGNARAALELAEPTRAAAAREDCRLIEWWALWICTEARRMLGSVASELPAIAAGLRECERLGHVRTAVRIRLALANALLVTGDIGEVAAMVEPACSHAQLMPNTRAQLATARALAAAAAGATEEAAPMPAGLQPYERAEWQLARCDVLLWQGRVGEAEGELARVDGALDATWALLACRRVLLRAEVALRRGAIARAGVLVEQALGAAAREPYASELARAQLVAAAVARCRGDDWRPLLARAAETAHAAQLAIELQATERTAPAASPGYRLAQRYTLADQLVVEVTGASASFRLTASQARDFDDRDYPTVFDLASGKIKLGRRRIDLAHHPKLASVLGSLVRAAAPLPLDQVASQAWGVEYHPIRHRGRTAMAIHRLRKQLGARAIVGDADGYRLAVQAPYIVIEPAG